MSHDSINRRNVLRTSGAALATLAAGSSMIGTAAAGRTPSVKTQHSSVSGSHVTTYALLESLGDDDSADSWFEWGPEGDGLPYDTCIHTHYSAEAFCDGYDSSCSMDTYGSLDPGTYEYQAVAYNDHGRSTGGIRTFTIY